MRALISAEPGPPESLRVVDLPEPQAGPGEVVIAVSHVGLNFFDTLIIVDRYQHKPPRPFSPGGECAGRIVAVGPGVAGLRTGDRVAAYVGWGAARERVVAPEEATAIIPDAVAPEIAAGVGVTYGTAMHGLIDRGELRAGETLAVLGAAGGAGLAAVEVGRMLGARVIACASSDEKLATARAAGAHETLNYATTGLRDGLKALTSGVGVDVVYDTVGDALAEPAFRALAWRGRHLVIGFAGGEIPRLPLNLPLLKGADLRGVFWGEFVRREPARHRAHVAAILDGVASGALSGRVHGVYPLEQAAEALGVIARREAVGKVVLAL